MLIWAAFWTVLCVFTGWGGEGKVTYLPSAWIAGWEYVEIEAWARSNNLTPATRKRSPELRLTNGLTAFSLVPDSRKLSVNGVTVWMSSPTALRRSSLYVSRVDLKTIFQPLIRPPDAQNFRPVRVVALDPGHGGKDPGNESGKHQEKKYTLLLAKEVEKLLEGVGLKVILTRGNDAFVDLDDRPKVARTEGADLFVSLHYNSIEAEQNSPSGVEVYCLTPPGSLSTNVRGDKPTTKTLAGNKNDQQNLLLAYHLQRSIVKTLPVEDRGVRHARWAVLRNAEMPAALIEAGFMSTQKDLWKISDNAFRLRMAHAIADGILAYKKVVDSVISTNAKPGPRPPAGGAGYTGVPAARGWQANSVTAY